MHRDSYRGEDRPSRHYDRRDYDDRRRGSDRDRNRDYDYDRRRSDNYNRDRDYDDRRRRRDDEDRGRKREEHHFSQRRDEMVPHHREEVKSAPFTVDRQGSSTNMDSVAKSYTQEDVEKMRASALSVLQNLSQNVLGGNVKVHSKTPWNLGEALLKLRLQADGVDKSGMELPSSKFERINGKWANRVNVPVDENPEMNFLGLLIGPGGETQRRLQSDSGARVVIRGKGSSKDGMDEMPDQPLHVFITGETFEQVEKATELVNDLLFNKDLQASLKNQQLRKVAEISGKVVSKQGFILNESLYAAETKDAFFPRPTGGVSDVVKVPKDRVGHIIGKGGDTIRMVQAKTGAFVQVSKDEGHPDDDFKIIEVEGTEEEVEAAKQEIQRLLDEFNDRRNRLGFVIPEGHEYMAVEIPNDVVGLLIGKSGQTIRQIQENSNAFVQVQKDSEVERNTSTRIVHVHGFPENVELARREIMLLMQQHEQQLQQTGGYASELPGSTEKDIRIPGSVIGYIIGRGGDTIKNLQMRHQSKVVIDKEDDADGYRHIQLRGLPANIEALEDEINDLVESQIDPSSHQRKTLELRSRKAASANPVTSSTPFIDPYYNYNPNQQVVTDQSAYTDPIALSAQQAAASAAAAAAGGDTNLYYEYYQQYYAYYYQQLAAQSQAM